MKQLCLLLVITRVNVDTEVGGGGGPHGDGKGGKLGKTKALAKFFQK